MAAAAFDLCLRTTALLFCEHEWEWLILGTTVSKYSWMSSVYAAAEKAHMIQHAFGNCSIVVNFFHLTDVCSGQIWKVCFSSKVKNDYAMMTLIAATAARPLSTRYIRAAIETFK